jgi:hypothetical protein
MTEQVEWGGMDPEYGAAAEDGAEWAGSNLPDFDGLDGGLGMFGDDEGAEDDIKAEDEDEEEEHESEDLTEQEAKELPPAAIPDPMPPDDDDS